MAPNLSLFSIPAYFALALGPHVYSVLLIRSANNDKWDNANPRSELHSEAIRKSVPAATYAKFERSRAAHNNMLENMGFMVGAVLAGCMVRLDANFMNAMTASYLVTRLLYTIAYVQIGRLKRSPIRTLLYFAGNVILITLYIQAGLALAKAGAS